MNSRAHGILLATVIVWVKLHKYIDMLTCVEEESADAAVATQGGTSSLFIVYLFIYYDCQSHCWVLLTNRLLLLKTLT